MFNGVFENSMLWKAQDRDIAKLSTINLRDFGFGKRKTVDDTPYGGGDGMLLMIEPLYAALMQAKKVSPKARVLLMTPRGKDYTQEDARRFAELKKDLIIICGRYEGYDERITEFVDEQICIGHFVLTGGEIAAMAVVDSIVRLLPGVLGGENSAEIESFSEDMKREFPQYTRPEEFKGLRVPDVLLSGHHGEIAKWRTKNSR